MPRTKKARGGSSRSELVRLAIAGIDAQIKELMDKRQQFAELVSGAVNTVRTVPADNGTNRMTGTESKVVPARRKRVVSAATRKKLKKAAKARWARVRAERS